MIPGADDVLTRQLVPGEALIRRYEKVVSQGRFHAALTDRRILLVARNATEDVHLAAIASMGWNSHPRWGLIAAGGFLCVLVVLSANTFFGLFTQFTTLLLLAGIALIVIGALFKKQAFQVHAMGRKLELTGNSQTIGEFMRDVRVQQARYSAYSPAGSNLPPLPLLGPMPNTPSMPGQPVGGAVVGMGVSDKRCPYCGNLAASTAEKCPSCGMPLTGEILIVEPKSGGTGDSLCAKCGAKKAGQSAFCSQCGSPWPPST